MEAKREKSPSAVPAIRLIQHAPFACTNGPGRNLAGVRRRVAPRHAATGRARGSYSRGKVFLASRAGRALHKRGLYAYCPRQFLLAQRDWPQDARRRERGNGEIGHRKDRCHQLAQTFFGGGETSPSRSNAERSPA